MVIKIGQRKETGDLVDALLECHERIRRFTAIARRLAESVGASSDEVSDAARSVWRYFTEALPRHVLDEDESILPRLQGRDPDVDAALLAMNQEHRDHQPELAQLIELCAALRDAPEKHASLAPALLAVALNLQAEFEVHLEQEERTILPALRSLLDESERAEISREMVLRRQP